MKLISSGEISLSLSLMDLLKGFDSLVDITNVGGKELGKSVSLKVGGDDIYLKENILSNISESVIHFLRNSIDHAIEPPKERVKIGKRKRNY